MPDKPCMKNRFIAALFLIIILSPIMTHAIGPSSGNHASETQSAVEEGPALVPPKVMIDGVALSEELILTALRFGWIQNKIFHSAQSSSSWAGKHFDDEIKGKLIPRELLGREAKRTGLFIDESAFNLFFKKRLMSRGGATAMSRLLESGGLDLDRYRTLSKHAYLARIYAEGAFKSEPTEAELLDYYKENRLKYGQGERRNVSFIQFKYSNAVPEGAAEELRNMAREIKDVTSLKAAAKKHQNRFEKKVIALTLLDIIHSEERPGVLWPIVKTMKEGECAFFEYNPLQYNLVLLEEIEPGNIPPFEEIEEKIRAKYSSELFQTNMISKVRELTNSSKIEFLYP